MHRKRPLRSRGNFRLGVERLSLTTSAIGLALTIGNLFNLGIVGFVGIFVDRYGRKPVIIPSCIFSALAFGGFAVATGYPMYVAAAIMWGVGVAGAGSASAAYAADQAPPGANGITLGIYRTLSDLGYVVGPAMLGLVAELSSAETALLSSAFLSVVVVIPFALFAPETIVRRARPARSRGA